MKTLSFTLVSLLIACSAMAGDMREVVKFGTYTNITTNTTTTTANAPDGNKFYYGDFEGFYIDFSGSTGTVTVTVTTDGDTGSGPSRLLFTNSFTAITDTWIPVRTMAKTESNGNATNEYVYVPLYQDKLNLNYSGIASTGMSFTAWVYIR